MMRALSLVALVGVVASVSLTSACATAAPQAWDSRSRAEREEYGDGDGWAGGGDAPMAVAEAQAPPSPLDFASRAIDGLFDVDKKAESGPPGETAKEPPSSSPSDPNNGKTEPSLDPKPIEAAKRLVIYTGSMSLMVPSTDVAVEAFLKQIETSGGYLQSRSSTTVTVRVPAGKFFETLDSLRKQGTVTDERIDAQDVTKRVFDLELRLQTAEESRKRLVDILKSATKIEDILRIESEIRRLTEEIELMKGELRTLGDQVAFSTLTVNFYANAPAPRPYPDRTRSRFEWINQIGVEQVLYGF